MEKICTVCNAVALLPISPQEEKGIMVRNVGVVIFFTKILSYLLENSCMCHNFCLVHNLA